MSVNIIKKVSSSSVTAKKNHFPIVAASAMTIQKSQGATFDAIVYHYEKDHPQSLLYVAISIVTNHSGLFMVVPTEESKKFLHNQVICQSTEPVRAELSRLAPRRLLTMDTIILNFSNNSQLSLLTHNS